MVWTMRKQLPGDERGQAQRRLVEQQHPGAQHEGPAEGEHLLLAAAEAARGLLEPLLQDREVLVDAFEVVVHGRAAPDVRAEPEVLLDGQRHERAAPLGHVGDAEPGDGVGRAAGQGDAAERDRAARPHHAGQGAQQRGLAGAVGAEDRADLALADGEAHAVQHLRVAVTGDQVLHHQIGTHAAVPR
ncbi:hypothetical protein GCM10020220_075620 [Nonomuraea rubra]